MTEECTSGHAERFVVSTTLCFIGWLNPIFRGPMPFSDRDHISHCWTFFGQSFLYLKSPLSFHDFVASHCFALQHSNKTRPVDVALHGVYGSTCGANHSHVMTSLESWGCWIQGEPQPQNQGRSSARTIQKSIIFYFLTTMICNKPHGGFLSHDGVPLVIIHFERWDFP